MCRPKFHLLSQKKLLCDSVSMPFFLLQLLQVIFIFIFFCFIVCSIARKMTINHSQSCGLKQLAFFLVLLLPFFFCFFLHLLFQIGSWWNMMCNIFQSFLCVCLFLSDFYARTTYIFASCTILSYTVWHQQVKK